MSSVSVIMLLQWLNTAISCITRGNDLGLQKIDLNTIYGNTVSLTGLLTYGIVYLIMLSANTTNV